MNKLKSEEALERIANFLEQLVIDKFDVTDEHEFLVLATYCRHTLFYDRQKDKIDLSQYNNIKDVYQDMMYKISSTPMLARFIVTGLFTCHVRCMEKGFRTCRRELKQYYKRMQDAEMYVVRIVPSAIPITEILDICVSYSQNIVKGSGQN